MACRYLITDTIVLLIRYDTASCCGLLAMDAAEGLLTAGESYASSLCALSIDPSTSSTPTHSPARCTHSTPPASPRRTARRYAGPTPPGSRATFPDTPAPRAGHAAGRRGDDDGFRGSSSRRCSC